MGRPLSELGPNDILLHYEEYGGLDIKVTIRKWMVVRYLMTVHRWSESRARFHANLIYKSNSGVRKAMGGDERFYEWMKADNDATAKKRFIPERSFIVCWLKGDEYNEAILTRERAAMSFFAAKKKQGLPCAMFDRVLDHKWRTIPIRKSVWSQEVIDMFYDRWIPEKNANVSIEERCRKNRGVQKCENCLRFGVYGSTGCPIYTQRKDAEKGEDDAKG